jgi:hypothetical protein
MTNKIINPEFSSAAPDVAKAQSAKAVPASGAPAEGIGTASPRRFGLFGRRAQKTIKLVGVFFLSSLGELTAILLGLTFFWMSAINMLLAQRVMDVSFMKGDAARWFSGAFDGNEAKIGGMSLAWEAADNTVIFRAADIAVVDKLGAPLNEINALESEFSLRDLARARIDPIRVAVDGGRLSWVRVAKGAFVGGLGAAETVGQLGPVWRGQKNDGDRDLDLGRLTSVNIVNATIFVRDALSDYDADLEGAALRIDIDGPNISFKGKAALTSDRQGAGPLAGLDIGGSISPDLEDFDVYLKGVALNPSRDLPRKGRLSALKPIDAPIDFEASLIARKGAGIEAFDVSAEAGAGRWRRGDRDMAFQSGKLTAAFNPETDQLNIKRLSIESEPLSLSGAAMLRNIGTPAGGVFKQDTKFDVNISSLLWTGERLGIDPVSLSGARIRGQMHSAEQSLKFDEISADFGTFTPVFSARLTRTDEGGLESVTAQGRINGEMSPKQLLEIWPRQTMRGARRWVARSIIDARLSNIEVDLSFDEAALSGQPLRDENLSMTFDLAEGQLRYISTMTPVVGAIGRGRVWGNRASFDIETGRIDDVLLGAGTVTIPRIYPYGGDLIIEGGGSGPLKTLIGLLDQKPFEYVTPYGVSPSDFSGEGEIELKITRPLREKITYEQVDFEVTGRLSDVTAPFSLGRHALTDGHVIVFANREGLSVKGPVQIGPWQADLAWNEIFDNGQTPTRYKVEGRMNQSVLDSFGVGLREFIGGGDVLLSIDAQADGLSIARSDIRADLTDTDMRIGPYWSKPKGARADMTGVMSLTKDRRFQLRDIELRAPGLELAGRLDIASDYKLLDMHLSKTRITGFIDAAVQIKPGPDQDRFDVFVTGDYLDVSPFVDQAMGSTGPGIDVPILMTAALNKLVLNEAYVLGNANFLFAHNGEGITQARLKGATPKGEFVANLTTDQENNLRELIVDIPNASDAAIAFFGIRSLTGGRLQIDADLPAVGVKGALRGRTTVKDVTLVNAPIMTTILSLASLQGLADALGGTGLKFENLDVPFSFDSGRLSVREARASGPALGMTASGELSLDQALIDIDGVLVPAYSANSLLGSIPVLGDIFVGKKGEGVFALSYTVKGPLKEAQVAVNPLSALTPGFLRNIFTPQRDDLPEGLRSTIEAVRPKAAPQPKP